MAFKKSTVLFCAMSAIDFDITVKKKTPIIIERVLWHMAIAVYPEYILVIAFSQRQSAGVL